MPVQARWLLYAKELTLSRLAVLRVKGCPLGYLDSEEVMQRYERGAC